MAGVPRHHLACPLVLTLAAAIAGGLARAGAVSLPALFSPAIVDHAFLMIAAFFGTVVALERAVALKATWGFAAPLGFLLSGVVDLVGAPRAADWLALAAALVFVAMHAALVARQRAPHILVLLAGATALAIGTALRAVDAASPAPVAWWFAFLVLTIAAERLEMTRLLKRRPGAAHALAVVLCALVAGAALGPAAPVAGGALFGVALAALAAWLLAFDVARRTVRAPGLPRYMAVCLLLGYAWLALAGLAWIAMSTGLAGWRDAALHALGLGFTFSMMLGHAPVILPAVARVKLRFGRAWYLPLAFLHASLVVRLAAGHADGALRALGAAGNAAAIAAFALTVAASVVLAHRSGPSRRLRRAPPRITS